MSALQCANPTCDACMNTFDEGVDCPSCGKWFCDSCFDRNKSYDCNAHMEVTVSPPEQEGFRVYECPNFRQISEAMFLVRPIHLIVGKSPSQAGYIVVNVKKIVAPSFASPGQFMFVGTVKEPSRVSLVRWYMDYETQRPVGFLRSWRQEPVPTRSRKSQVA